MNPIVIFSVCLVLSTLSTCSSKPATSSDPVGNGRYIHMVEPYVHVHDNRELGKYVHIPNPYDGGYGPYSGLNNPYRHDDSGNYDKYTTSSTTTRRPTTTTTTTMRPRLFNYHEEGGWRILRQEEEKAKHKYDFLYHTENGIYGEEKAHLRHGAGTAASGYYEYTGDDGELYRVNYKSDERGFIPEADHIPTPPPVPDAIKRALEYVAKKKETHGIQSGHYEHKPDPIRRQNMPTADRPVNRTPQAPQLPAAPQFSQQQPLQQSAPLVPKLPAAPQLLQQQPLQNSALVPTLPLPTLGARPNAPASGGLISPLVPKPNLPASVPVLPNLTPKSNAPVLLPTAGTKSNVPGSVGLLPTLPLPTLPAKANHPVRLTDQIIQQSQYEQQSEPQQLLQIVKAPKSVSKVEQDAVVQLVQQQKQELPVQLAKVEAKPILLEQPLLNQQPQILIASQPVQVPQLIKQIQTEEQPQQDQPQPEEQLQQDQPQEELQPQKEEQPKKSEELPQAEGDLEVQQSEDIATYVLPDENSGKNIDPEPSPLLEEKSETQASEKEEKYDVPFKVEESLKDEDNFELTTS